MAILDSIVGKLRSARDAITSWLDDYFNENVERSQSLDNIVSQIRRIPASDMDKKRELARYFQTPQGQFFSAEQKREAYNDLLGAERNKRTLG